MLFVGGFRSSQADPISLGGFALVAPWLDTSDVLAAHAVLFMSLLLLFAVTVMFVSALQQRMEDYKAALKPEVRVSLAHFAPPADNFERLAAAVESWALDFLALPRPIPPAVPAQLLVVNARNSPQVVPPRGPSRLGSLQRSAFDSPIGPGSPLQRSAFDSPVGQGSPLQRLTSKNEARTPKLALAARAEPSEQVAPQRDMWVPFPEAALPVRLVEEGPVFAKPAPRLCTPVLATGPNSGAVAVGTANKLLRALPIDDMELLPGEGDFVGA